MTASLGSNFNPTARFADAMFHEDAAGARSPEITKRNKSFIEANSIHIYPEGEPNEDKTYFNTYRYKGGWVFVFSLNDQNGEPDGTYALVQKPEGEIKVQSLGETELQTTEMFINRVVRAHISERNETFLVFMTDPHNIKALAEEALTQHQLEIARGGADQGRLMQLYDLVERVRVHAELAAKDAPPNSTPVSTLDPFGTSY